MSTPVDLADYQHQLGPVLIGRGTTVDIRAIEGLGQVALRSSDVEPPGEDGLWLGPDYYGGRTVRIDAAVKNSGNSAAVLDTVALLQDASDTAAVRGQAGTTLDLRVKFPGRPARVLRGRLRKFEPDLTTLKHGYVPLDLEFQTADHRYYADTSDSTSMPLGGLTEGGVTFPSRCLSPSKAIHPP
ncbi:hypothetical protein ACFQ0X_43575 [Streptomyces rectiviolaceus]|uniref:hypothetical protein n=1 Tax=Streptomyces rectiviolaceus TaxID=332591 RepID=UPI003629B2F7